MRIRNNKATSNKIRCAVGYLNGPTIYLLYTTNRPTNEKNYLDIQWWHCYSCLEPKLHTTPKQMKERQVAWMWHIKISENKSVHIVFVKCYRKSPPDLTIEDYPQQIVSDMNSDWPKEYTCEGKENNLETNCKNTIGSWVDNLKIHSVIYFWHIMLFFRRLSSMESNSRVQPPNPTSMSTRGFNLRNYYHTMLQMRPSTGRSW